MGFITHGKPAITLQVSACGAQGPRVHSAALAAHPSPVRLCGTPREHHSAAAPLLGRRTAGPSGSIAPRARPAAPSGPAQGTLRSTAAQRRSVTSAHAVPGPQLRQCSFSKNSHQRPPQAALVKAAGQASPTAVPTAARLAFCSPPFQAIKSARVLPQRWPLHAMLRAPAAPHCATLSS